MARSKLEIRKAVTINLGNFENVKVEIAFERELGEKETPDNLYASINEFVIEKIEAEIEKYSEHADPRSNFKKPFPM